MSLVGSAGQECTNIRVGGGPAASSCPYHHRRQGQGGSNRKLRVWLRFHLPGSWRVPSEPAKEYHVRVKMKAGPFEINQENESVIAVDKL